MGFRFFKRINLGKGIGINISNFGISSSFRNKRGSISIKGFSIKTGIPGVSYRSKGCSMVIISITIIGISIIRCVIKK